MANDQRPIEEKKSTWKQRLRNLVVEDVPIEESTPAPITTNAGKQPVIPSPIENVILGSTNSDTGIVDEQYEKDLQEVLDHADQPGIDYAEFARGLGIEAMTYRSKDKYVQVYNILKGADKTFSKKKLLDSGAFYISVLEEQKKIFDTKYNTAMQSKVESRKQEASTLQTEIDELEKEKQQLESIILQKRTSIAAIVDEASKKEIELQRKRKNFSTTVDKYVNLYTENLKNITEFIPEEQPTTTK